MWEYKIWKQFGLWEDCTGCWLTYAWAQCSAALFLTWWMWTENNKKEQWNVVARRERTKRRKLESFPPFLSPQHTHILASIIVFLMWRRLWTLLRHESVSLTLEWAHWIDAMRPQHLHIFHRTFSALKRLDFAIFFNLWLH
jgi:hypothetical protein